MPAMLARYRSSIDDAPSVSTSGVVKGAFVVRPQKHTLFEICVDCYPMVAVLMSWDGYASKWSTKSSTSIFSIQTIQNSSLFAHTHRYIYVYIYNTYIYIYMCNAYVYNTIFGGLSRPMRKLWRRSFRGCPSSTWPNAGRPQRGCCRWAMTAIGAVARWVSRWIPAFWVASEGTALAGQRDLGCTGICWDVLG